MAEPIVVEVVYALPNTQDLVRLRMPKGSTVEQAIATSGFLAKYPDIALSKNKVGVYGKLTKPDATLHDRDRVEIYRALIADPKEVRKKRAEEGKATKKGKVGEEG